MHSKRSRVQNRVGDVLPLLYEGNIRSLMTTYHIIANSLKPQMISLLLYWSDTPKKSTYQSEMVTNRKLSQK